MSERIAVVIPVYNRPRQLLDALSRVMKQTLRPEWILVIDDGSTEPVRAEVDRWVSESSEQDRVQVITQANLGAACARNRGLAAVPEAACVAFLDSDDLWPIDFLERASAALEAHADAVAVTADRVFEKGPLGRFVRREDSHQIAEDSTTWILRHSGGIGSATLCRAEPVRQLGGYDESIATGHDTALFLRLSLLGSWLHLPGAPVLYRSGRYLIQGEEDHLRYRYRDFRVRWAEVDEAFLQSEKLRHQIPRSIYSRHLARRWRLAGDQLASDGDCQGARRCYKRSLRWHFKWKTLKRIPSTLGPSTKSPGI